MKNFRSFLQEKKGVSSPEAPAKGQAEAARKLQQQAQALEGKSEGELMSELEKAVAMGKEDGSFTAETVAQFVARVSPLLTEEQRQRMHSILQNLK